MPQFFKIFNMQGFDRAIPPWQMVPVDGDRYVALGDGAGLSVRSEYPPVASAKEVRLAELPDWGPREQLLSTDRCFRLHSGSKGSTSILAYERSRVVARLEVDTKFDKTLQVTFNFVRDNAGEKTIHKPAEAVQWIRELNWIYQQCNIRFVCRAARWVEIDADLGWVISYVPYGSAKDNEEWNLVVAKRDPGANVNAFHFNDVRLGHPAQDNASGLGPSVGAKCFFIDDDAKSYVKTLAHEIGHTQGLLDRIVASGWNLLMAPWDGVDMTRDDVNKINP